METSKRKAPSIRQSLDEGDTSQGYGLVQWTPATKFLEWCDSEGLDPEDMDSALLRIVYELDNGLQYYPTDDYPETFAEFKVSTKDANYLGMAFVSNYERPAEISAERGENAGYWYEYLSDYYAGDTGADELIPWVPKGKKNLPLWLLISMARKR